MNIQTDAIVGNQCGRNEYEKFDYNGCEIQFMSFDSRGVGINRNNVLMRATSDICVLADDDMQFDNNYAEVVGKCFNKFPDADILIFNLKKGKKSRYKNIRVKRINRFNYAKYGAARIAFRTDSIRINGIFFNTMFGGGCKYSCGEDTLFLRECIGKGLKIYAVPLAIASIDDEKSSWFEGYTDKYFFDKGVLYYFLSKKFCLLHTLYHALKYRRKYKQYGWIKAFLQMRKGMRSVKK